MKFHIVKEKGNLSSFNKEKINISAVQKTTEVIPRYTVTYFCGEVLWAMHVQLIVMFKLKCKYMNKKGKFLLEENNIYGRIFGQI